MQPMRKYRAAAIQFEPAQGAKDTNLAAIERLIRRAAAGDARLIVLPEMATIGLLWHDREDIAPFVEPIPGETTRFFEMLARELDVYLVAGMGEVDPQTGIYYNSAILVSPDGFVGQHRKVHGYLSDPLWAGDGNLGFQVWETPLGKLGIMICMDANYPESGRLLALDGADVILMPVGWVDEVCPAPLWITRAFDNGVTTVCANRWGTERGARFSGGSCILNPDGSIQACIGRSDHDEIVYGDIDLDDLRRQYAAGDPALHPLASRRPELYGALALNRYLWNPVTMHAHFGAAPLLQGARFYTFACEFAPSEQSINVRLSLLERLFDKPADNLPRLVVLPECSFTGVPNSCEEAMTVAETIPGATTNRLEAWCVQAACHLVTGLVERDGDKLYNTIVLITPDGLRARYRKTHLSGSDKRWATPGDRLVWTDTSLGRIGLLTGTDLLFPEPVRCLAIEGADVVCVSAALTAPMPIHQASFSAADQGDKLHWHLARIRAVENDVVVAFANLRGDNGAATYMGHSGIFFEPPLFFSPAAESLATIASANGAALTRMLIDTRTGAGPSPDNPIRAKPSIARRLPGWYTPLLKRTPSVVETAVPALPAKL